MTDIGALGMVVLTFLAMVLAAALRPERASCPDRWYLNDGIRRDGTFSCAPPLPLCCGEATGACERRACPDLGHVTSRIYCTGGAVPIIVNERTVGCQRW